jgi:hypothetical protein
MGGRVGGGVLEGVREIGLEEFKKSGSVVWYTVCMEPDRLFSQSYI